MILKKRLLNHMSNNNNNIPKSRSFVTPPGHDGCTEILALVCETVANTNLVICEKGVQGVCGSCHDRKDSCIPDVMAGRPSTPERFEVENTFKAKTGDVVRIAVCERSIWLSVVVSYLIPLLSMMIGASGSAIISFFLSGEIKDLVTILGAFLGLFFGISLACYLAKYLVQKIWTPKMLGVLGAVKPCN